MEDEWREIYNKYIQSNKWRKKALVRKSLDGSRCIVCDKDESIEVHHMTYSHLCNEPINHLITLCIECHERLHGHLKENQLTITISNCKIALKTMTKKQLVFNHIIKEPIEKKKKTKEERKEHKKKLKEEKRLKHEKLIKEQALNNKNRKKKKKEKTPKQKPLTLEQKNKLIIAERENKRRKGKVQKGYNRNKKRIMEQKRQREKEEWLKNQTNESIMERTKNMLKHIRETLDSMPKISGKIHYK